ncbi:MAG: hypothetical protein ACI828_001703 [Flavobacteriales bacterium]|jgi:hypothetical protein
MPKAKYQLYKDLNDRRFCSSKKVTNHSAGDQWIQQCIAAHGSVSVRGKSWVSQKQTGIIWP